MVLIISSFLRREKMKKNYSTGKSSLISYRNGFTMSDTQYQKNCIRPRWGFFLIMVITLIMSAKFSAHAVAFLFFNAFYTSVAVLQLRLPINQLYNIFPAYHTLLPQLNDLIVKKHRIQLPKYVEKLVYKYFLHHIYFTDKQIKILNQLNQTKSSKHHNTCSFPDQHIFHHRLAETFIFNVYSNSERDQTFTAVEYIIRETLHPGVNSLRKQVTAQYCIWSLKDKANTNHRCHLNLLHLNISTSLIVHKRFHSTIKFCDILHTKFTIFMEVLFF